MLRENSLLGSTAKDVRGTMQYKLFAFVNKRDKTVLRQFHNRMEIEDRCTKVLVSNPQVDADRIQPQNVWLENLLFKRKESKCGWCIFWRMLILLFMM